jgi:hypothetical protein
LVTKFPVADPDPVVCEDLRVVVNHAGKPPAGKRIPTTGTRHSRGRERVWQHAQTMEDDPVPAAQPETTPRRSLVRARLAARTAVRVKVSLAS